MLNLQEMHCLRQDLEAIFSLECLNDNSGILKNWERERERAGQVNNELTCPKQFLVNALGKICKKCIVYDRI